MLAKRSLVPLLFLASCLLASCLVAAGLSGCKRSHSRAVSAAEPATRPRLDISNLTDDQLVATNQQDGLGLALRVPGGDTFPASRGVPLHVLIEDFAARQPIASGMCEGFFIAYEDAATHESSTSELSMNPRCLDADPYPDAVPLAKGQVKFTDVNSNIASHAVLAPGHYLLHLEWRAIPAGPGTIAIPPPYSVLQSNTVPITITQ